MEIISAVIGALLIATILWDAFETIVFPRRVTRRLYLSRLFIRAIWRFWAALACWLKLGRRRETYLSLFGPLSLILLLVFWAGGMIVGFGLLQWALGSQLAAPEGAARLSTDLYMSGTTFFTLGLGDVTPRSDIARTITIGEAGLGFGFLALVISYLPVLYQSFSQREVRISMLDERAGSPPTAGEMLRRLSEDGSVDTIGPFLEEWEHWAATLLESHLSYPILAYYRSQHENQSWLTGLTVILDACALVIAGIEGLSARPARLAFAMARHCAADLSQILNIPPIDPARDRLPADDLRRLRAFLREAGVGLREGDPADQMLTEMRRMYEPFVNALSLRLLMPLPSWLPEPDVRDNWQSTAWEFYEGRRLG